ncbi:hypothetical protein NliqN6_2796 [Naganishia liquefaciens]|uniref:SGNH hydrolase-type esterase domain-containing protein n=1 Tax=Naganishia liquefaciens TaxID=104408 RepID=A0A8H3YEE9_9TREE|nr:hypothetical protein NliqN6_2796 [Naganishia liquefaciens]
MTRRDSLEMSDFPGTTEPLLSAGQPQQPQRRKSLPIRIPRPLLFIGIPIFLTLLYASLTQITPLPPLPTIRIVHPGDRIDGAQNVITIAEECACGIPSLGKGQEIQTEGERMCDIYGKDTLERSRLFTGTGGRVQRMLEKAQRERRALKVGILGGSVSACHAAHPSPEHPQGDPAGPGCYTTLLKQWLDKRLPLSPYKKHSIMNGAIGGMDSSYYAFCGTHHIPKDVDLIILEFDVNDQASALYQHFFDQLLRALLDLPSSPALIILGAWAPSVALDQGYADPQLVHLPIATYYDIPYLSLKRMVWESYLRWPGSVRKAFWVDDGLHPNVRGHRLLADILTAYLEYELCRVSILGLPIPLDPIRTLATKDKFVSAIDISFPFDTPRMTDPRNPPEGWEQTFNDSAITAIAHEPRRFLSKLSPYALPLSEIFTPLREIVTDSSPESDPPNADALMHLVQPEMFCADANDPEHPMRPTDADGWEEYVWNNEKHYWVSDQVGARIRVDIKVAEGRIAVYYFRSQRYDLGDAKCWVDDNEAGAKRLPGWWSKQYNVASVAYIDEKVTPGDHYVTCEIMQETSHPTNPDAHHFRLVAVMAT